jgi:hypothetical protein
MQCPQRDSAGMDSLDQPKAISVGRGPGARRALHQIPRVGPPVVRSCTKSVRRLGRRQRDVETIDARPVHHQPQDGPLIDEQLDGPAKAPCRTNVPSGWVTAMNERASRSPPGARGRARPRPGRQTAGPDQPAPVTAAACPPCGQAFTGTPPAVAAWMASVPVRGQRASSCFSDALIEVSEAGSLPYLRWEDEEDEHGTMDVTSQRG